MLSLWSHLLWRLVRYKSVCRVSFIACLWGIYPIRFLYIAPCVFSVDWHLAGIRGDLYASLSCGCCLVNHATNNDLYVCKDCIYISPYIEVVTLRLNRIICTPFSFEFERVCGAWVLPTLEVLVFGFCHANYNLCWSCWMWHVFTILPRMQLINFVQL